MCRPYSDVLGIQTQLTVTNFSMWRMSYLKIQHLTHLSLLLLQQHPWPGPMRCPLLSISVHLCIWGSLGLPPSFPWPCSVTHLYFSLATLMLSSIKWWARFFRHATMFFTATAMWLYANCCPLLGSWCGFCHQSYFSAASAFFWQSKWRFHLHCNPFFCLF